MADNNTNQERPRGIDALKQHINENKVDVALWASRILTIIFAIGYVLPIFGFVFSSLVHHLAQFDLNFFIFVFTELHTIHSIKCY